MSKYFKYIIIIWLVALVAIVAGSLNSVTSPPEEYHMDKFVHLGAFAFLSFLIPLFVKNVKIRILFIIIVIVAGGGIELMQNNIPGREASWLDFIADVVGVFVGLVFYYFVKKLKF